MATDDKNPDETTTPDSQAPHEHENPSTPAPPASVNDPETAPVRAANTPPAGLSPTPGSSSEVPPTIPPVADAQSEHGRHGRHAPKEPANTQQRKADVYPPPNNNAYAVNSNPERKKSHVLRNIGIALLLIALMLASGLVGGLVADRLNDNEDLPISSAVESDSPLGDPEPAELLAKVAAEVAPSVVSIEVQSPNGLSSGSGVILKTDGTILTNNHVIEPGVDDGMIQVRFFDGTIKEAQILGRDEATDLAVIKTEGSEDLTPAVFGNIEDLSVGDTVLAIGSPLGLEGSVSSGIISALGRTVRLGANADTGTLSLVTDAIQTDAAINPGNSGGPLVNMDGEVIGINTAIAALGTGSQAGSIGLGFAINADQAVEISDILAAGETPVRPVLGVTISAAPEGGAVVESVITGGPSDGTLQVGDVIMMFNGEEVLSPDDLTALVRAQSPGDEAVLTLTRDGKEEEVTVTLEES